MKKKLVVIAGPTAVGKSRVAIEIATSLGGEIVNADSMQVYRHMDIGTAKPEKEDLKRVPHHMIDIVDPDEDFNAGTYTEMARWVIDRIHERGRVPVVVGGTGLYIRTLTRGIFHGPGKNEAIRRHLEEMMERDGLPTLYDLLREVDPEGASRIHPRDRLRIVRALEVYHLTGVPISRWQRTHGFREEPYETLKIGLYMERELLYKRIEERVDEMMEKGLLEEVRTLLKMGYGPELKPMQGLGYREMCSFLRGEMELDEAVRLIKRNTRRYAKRQFTWFRKEEGMEWFRPDDLHSLLERIRVFLRP